MAQFLLGDVLRVSGAEAKARGGTQWWVGASTYSTHLSVRPEERGCGGRERMKAQIPFSPLNSFIHLFVAALLSPRPEHPLCLSVLASLYNHSKCVERQRFTVSALNSFTSEDSATC